MVGRMDGWLDGFVMEYLVQRLISMGSGVARLAVRSLPTLEVRGSNPVIGNVLTVEKAKKDKKRPGMAHSWWLNSQVV